MIGLRNMFFKKPSTILEGVTLMSWFFLVNQTQTAKQVKSDS